MKTLAGTAQAKVSQGLEECFALLVAFEGYPSWYPEVVQAVEIVESDSSGVATSARAKLHVAHGPLVKDFDLLLAIEAQPLRSVKLARIGGDPADEQRFEVRWDLADGQPTQISLALNADLSIPRFVPIGDVGDAIADGFMRAAVAQLATA